MRIYPTYFHFEFENENLSSGKEITIHFQPFTPKSDQGNFSLQYDITQTSNKKGENIVRDYYLIQHQFSSLKLYKLCDG